ncbi:MAG: hypothetical protein ACFFEN_02640 [Candidatus Thorarchaeota archaeon]
MKVFKIEIISLAFWIFLLCLNLTYTQSIANPLPVYETKFGGFLPNEDYSCSMPNASVLIEIDATDPYSYFGLVFTGNYTIFNPNDSLNLTIAAPFTKNIFGLDSNCTIKINNSVIPHDVVRYPWNESYTWDDYIMIYNRNLIVCNLSLPKNKSILLEYNFKTNLESLLRDVSYLNFIYDIGTAAVWEGKISETVEFRVIGRLPDSHSNDPMIMEILNGKSFIWEFKNVEIPPGLLSVYISYLGDYEYNWFKISLGYFFLIFLLLGFISLIILQRRIISIKW